MDQHSVHGTMAKTPSSKYYYKPLNIRKILGLPHMV